MIFDSQQKSEEKQRLLSIIDSKLEIEFNIAFIRQDPSIANTKVAEKVMQLNANVLAQKLTSIEELVTMASVISKKVLHEFLQTKCKEHTIEITKSFRINKLKAELTTIINEGGSSEEILNIESQIKELGDEDVDNALKKRKNYNILEANRKCILSRMNFLLVQQSVMKETRTMKNFTCN